MHTTSALSRLSLSWQRRSALIALVGLFVLGGWLAPARGTLSAADEPAASAEDRAIARIATKMESLVGRKVTPRQNHIDVTVGERVEKANQKWLRIYINVGIPENTAQHRFSTHSDELKMEDVDIGKPRKAQFTLLNEEKYRTYGPSEKQIHGARSLAYYVQRWPTARWYGLSVEINRSAAAEEKDPAKRKEQSDQLARDCRKEAEDLLKKLIDIVEEGGPSGETADDYLSWYAETAQLNSDLNEATLGIWVTIAQITAATRLEKARAARIDLLLGQPVSLRGPLGDDGLYLIDDRDTSEKLRASQQAALEQAESNGLLQNDLMISLDAGWDALEGRVADRLKREGNRPERREHLEGWLNRVRQDRQVIQVDLQVLANHDAGVRRNQVRLLREQFDRTNNEDQRLRCVVALQAVGGRADALEAAHAFTAKHPKNTAGHQALQEAEIDYLGLIESELRGKAPNVDRVLTRLGGSQVNPSTGEWQWEEVVKSTDRWSQLPELLFTDSSQQWKQGEDSRARAAELVLGLHALRDLRSQGIRLQDVSKLDGEALLSQLRTQRRFAPEDRQELARRLKLAVYRASVQPEVAQLMEGKTPQLKKTEAHLALATFLHPLMDWTLSSGSWVAKEILWNIGFGLVIRGGVIALGGAASGTVYGIGWCLSKCPKIETALNILGARRLLTVGARVIRGIGAGAGALMRSRVVSTPAAFFARIQRAFATSLPGWKGRLAEQAYDKIIMPQVVGAGVKMTHQGAAALEERFNTQGKLILASTLACGYILAVDMRRGFITDEVKGHLAATMVEAHRSVVVNLSKECEELHKSLETVQRYLEKGLDIGNRLKSLQGKLKNIAESARKGTAVIKTETEQLSREAQEMVKKLLPGNSPTADRIHLLEEWGRAIETESKSVAKGARLTEQQVQRLQPFASAAQAQGTRTASELDHLNTLSKQYADTLGQVRRRVQPDQAVKPVPPVKRTPLTPDETKALLAAPGSLDNDFLIEAFRQESEKKGGLTLQIAKSPNKFLTQEVYDEFITNYDNIAERLKRRAWLADMGLKPRKLTYDPSLFKKLDELANDPIRASGGKPHSRSDLLQGLRALEFGHTMFTGEGRFPNEVVGLVNRGKWPGTNFIQVQKANVGGGAMTWK